MHAGLFIQEVVSSFLSMCIIAESTTLLIFRGILSGNDIIALETGDSPVSWKGRAELLTQEVMSSFQNVLCDCSVPDRDSSIFFCNSLMKLQFSAPSCWPWKSQAPGGNSQPQSCPSTASAVCPFDGVNSRSGSLNRIWHVDASTSRLANLTWLLEMTKNHRTHPA